MLNNNLLALVITFAVAITWLRLNDFAAHRGWISGRLSRKIIHTGTGPLFVLCWPLFTNDPISPILAALVPGLITVQFALVGMGIIKDEQAVKGLTRTGNRREILYGPLFYGIVFVIATLIYWLNSPIGIVALMLMCGGDGLADIFGRRFGSLALPWNPAKSWAGSLAMLLGGFGFSVIILWIFISLNIFAGPITGYLLPLAVIALAGAIVESLPIHDIDNITTTGVAILLGHLLF